MLTRFVSALAFSFFAVVAVGEETKPAPSVSPHALPPMEFDSFIVVLLVRAPNAPELPKPQLDELADKHIANIHRLADEGKLLKAGPMEDHSGRNVRGMFILKTESVDQAREWVGTDPLVKAGRLLPEFLKWSVQKGNLK